MSETTLRVSGRCEAGEVEFTYADCKAAAARHRIPDLGAVLPDRRGTAIRFGALIERVRPHADAAFVNVASSDGGFTASLPVEDLAQRGILLYALDDEPLPETYGGPFRLFVADGEDCAIQPRPGPSPDRHRNRRHGRSVLGPGGGQPYRQPDNPRFEGQARGR